MSRFTILKQLMRKHKYQLIATYSLFSLEMLGALVRPFLLGLAVNDLIKGSYNGVLILSAVHLCWLSIGVVRHMYDTRTYSAIYTTLVTKFLNRRYGKTEVSKLSAHSTLSREFVDFLEFDLAYIMEAFYNLFGSLAFLYFYDRSVVAICFAILLPVMSISFFYGKKMTRLTQLKNDELEKQVNIISEGKAETVSRHYNRLRKWQIKISDNDAINFGLIELMVIIVIAISLIISQQGLGSTVLAGNLIGIYTYILKFVSGLDTIPYTVQRISTLSDITKRIKLNENEISDNSTDPAFPINVFTPIKLSA